MRGQVRRRRHADTLRQQGITVGKGLAGPRRQQSAERAFAAARHPDQYDVFLALPDGGIYVVGSVRHIRAIQKQSRRIRRLRDQHIQPAGGGNTARPRTADKCGPQRVVHRVRHAAQVREVRRVCGYIPIVREHPDRSRVEQDSDVLPPPVQGIIPDGILPGRSARHADDRCRSLRPQDGAGG